MSEWGVAVGRGLVGLVRCVADVGGGSCRVDVDGRGVWHQLDVAGAALNNGGIG